VPRRSCIRMSRLSTWRMSRAYRPLLSSRNLQDGGRCAAVSRLVAEFMALSYTFQKRTIFFWKDSRFLYRESTIMLQSIATQKSFAQWAIYYTNNGLPFVYVCHYWSSGILWLIWEIPGFWDPLDGEFWVENIH
jgi:hypothetical protein